MGKRDEEMVKAVAAIENEDDEADAEYFRPPAPQRTLTEKNSYLFNRVTDLEASNAKLTDAFELMELRAKEATARANNLDAALRIQTERVVEELTRADDIAALLTYYKQHEGERIEAWRLRVQARANQLAAKRKAEDGLD